MLCATFSKLVRAYYGGFYTVVVGFKSSSLYSLLLFFNFDKLFNEIKEDVGIGEYNRYACRQSRDKIDTTCPFNSFVAIIASEEYGTSCLFDHVD